MHTGAMMANGGIRNILGNAAGGWFNDLSQQARNENMQDRVTRMMLENPMSGEALRTVRHYAPRQGAR